MCVFECNVYQAGLSRYSHPSLHHDQLRALGPRAIGCLTVAQQASIVAGTAQDLSIIIKPDSPYWRAVAVKP